MAIVSASIVDIEECVDETGRQFVAYTIESVRAKAHRRQQAVYTTRRRYADFVTLHARLQPEGPGAIRREFPVPKQGFERALNLPLSPQKARDRANGLQQYLHEVVASPPTERAQLAVLRAFLGIGLNESDPSVIIVGAGLAGLSAAHHLASLGIHDILVLEAGDRIGGRVHSIPFAGYTVEAGAQWVHGCRDNPLFGLVAELGLHGVVEPDAPIAVRAQHCLSADLAGRVEERLALLDSAIARVQRLAAQAQAGGAAEEAVEGAKAGAGAADGDGARSGAGAGAGAAPRASGAPGGALGARDGAGVGGDANGAGAERHGGKGTGSASCSGGGPRAGPAAHRESAAAAPQQRAPAPIGDMSVRCALRFCGWHPEDELDNALEHWRWDYDYGEKPEGLSLRHNCAEEYTAADFDESDFLVADPRGFAAVAEHLAAAVFGGGGGAVEGGDDDLSGRGAFGGAEEAGFSPLPAAGGSRPFASPGQHSAAGSCADGLGGSGRVASGASAFGSGAGLGARSCDQRLRLNARVTRIERAAQGGVLVSTADGHSHSAAIVLVTVSVGVLQAVGAPSRIQFVPELPLPKLQAVHELSMGGYTKVFLAFASKFWPEEQRHILIAHPRRGLYGIVTHLGSGVTRYPPSEAHVLCVTITGDEARRVEGLSDEEVIDEIGQLFSQVAAPALSRQREEERRCALRCEPCVWLALQELACGQAVWGEQPVPPPLEAKVCRWSSDPLFLGAFSVIPPNALRDGHSRLQEPVGPIHFAGEACHARYSGFAHGALLSGRDAAAAIAAALASAPPERADCSLFKPLDGARRAVQGAALTLREPSSGTSSPSVRSGRSGRSEGGANGAGGGSSATTPKGSALSLAGLSLRELAARFTAATPTVAAHNR